MIRSSKLICSLRAETRGWTKKQRKIVAQVMTKVIGDKCVTAHRLSFGNRMKRCEERAETHGLSGCGRDARIRGTN